MDRRWLISWLALKPGPGELRSRRSSLRFELAETENSLCWLSTPSAVIAALIGQPRPATLIDRLSKDGDLHAPHLIDIEFLHALRRLNVKGQLSDDRASDARTDFDELAIVRYPHMSLADRVWDLRRNATAYDAAFIALSEVLEVPLVTCDSALSTVPGHSAQIETY